MFTLIYLVFMMPVLAGLLYLLGVARVWRQSWVLAVFMLPFWPTVPAQRLLAGRTDYAHGETYSDHGLLDHSARYDLAGLVTGTSLLPR
ncbi:hypothetical protein [Dokdonella soli]|uniref:Uncharacterized protein n=1 Tax=Dokdonella soli TaxID=529810 RepID=A0ABN1IKL8_9GAMM